MHNRAEWRPDGVLATNRPNRVRAETAPDWVGAVRESGRMSVECTARPKHLDQSGPARLVTLSRDGSHRNFTLGQDGDELVVRLRRGENSCNGVPAWKVPGAFVAGRDVRVRMDLSPGRLLVQVDDEVAIDATLPEDALLSWDPAFRLALGNEVTGYRSWEGELHRVVLEAGGRQFDLLEPARWEMPDTWWRIPARLLRAAEGDFTSTPDAADIALNLLGFVPLGLLLAGRRGWVLPLLGIALLSLAMECGQVFFDPRYPSPIDLALNCAGGVLGLAAGRAGRGPREAGA